MAAISATWANLCCTSWSSPSRLLSCGHSRPISEETRLEGLYSAHAINGWSRCHVLLHSRLPRGGQKRTGETPEACPQSALAHQRTQAVLMPEVAHPGEDHGEAGGVGGGDDFVVAQRAAGLDHGSRAGLRDHLQTVGEGKEGV